MLNQGKQNRCIFSTANPDLISLAVNAVTGDAKYRQMAENTIEQTKSTPLTTYFGVKVPETDVALRAGARGPTLLEGKIWFSCIDTKSNRQHIDFHNREKIQHFDHERIPERVVHARGSAAHGEFKLHTPLTGITTAKVNQRAKCRMLTDRVFRF